MTIGKKLFLSFGAVMILMLGVSFVGLQSIGELAAANENIVNVKARKLYLGSNINTDVTGVLAAERGVLVRAYMHDRPTMEQYHADFYRYAADAKKRLEEFMTLSNAPEDRQAVTEIRGALEIILRGHGELWNQAISNRLDAAGETYRVTTNPAIKRSVKIAQELTARQSAALAAVAQDTKQVATRARFVMLGTVALTLLVAGTAVFVVRQINSGLRFAVTELSAGADQVASAASQISASSQSLAQGSSEQAASLEETSASSEEINSMARQNTQNSRSAADLVTQAQQKFLQANASLNQSVVAIDEINSQSSRISKIIKTIDEIAFQTNILALNAAVEAARAGEAGMGFAVVAEEVRNLAQRSAQAAKDTAELIDESIIKSHAGKVKVDEVAVAIRAFTEETAKVKLLVDEVNSGSQEQARGILQISRAITQMEQVTQRAAANAEESASAAVQLNAQSETLRDIVERLIAMVE
ncbi:MAG: methyl-accepting chemotaxis protein [Bryobacteraceae bacterium]